MTPGNFYLPIAGHSLNVFVLLGLGGAVGFLSGLTGVGGGFLMTPLLIMGGIPPTIAAASDSNQIVASTTSGTYAHYRMGNVDFKMGVVLLTGGTFGGMIGVRIIKVLRILGNADFFIKVTYVVMLALAGSYMLVESIHSRRCHADPDRGEPPTPSRFRRFIHSLPWQCHFAKSNVTLPIVLPFLVGACVGMLAAVMGLGGGFIMVPLMCYVLEMPMHVTCDLPSGSQAVLAIRGKWTEAELMRKAHHWDLWMNGGEVDIDHVPRLYIALSSDPGLLDAGSREAPWGYGAIEREAGFSGRMKPSERDSIFEQFVALKERDELYHLYPGGLKISQTATGVMEAEAGFHLPSRLKAGIYHVTLWIVHDGRVTQQRNAVFEVRLKGVPAFLHSLAQQHGVLYGFFAAAIAMAAGLFIGLIFHHGDGHR